MGTPFMDFIKYVLSKGHGVVNPFTKFLEGLRQALIWGD